MKLNNHAFAFEWWPYHSNKMAEDVVVRISIIKYSIGTYRNRFLNLTVDNKLCVKLQTFKRAMKFDRYNWFVG